MRTDQNKPLVKLAEHRNYFSTANFQIKIIATFRGTYGIFRRFWKLSFIYSTISRGTPNHVVRSPGWRTPKIRRQIIHTWYALKTQHKYTYAHTHTNDNTYACINTTHIYACRCVAGEEWCSRPRRQSPRGGTIKTSSKKTSIFYAPIILNYWAIYKKIQ
jgi:hypothetical protein